MELQQMQFGAVAFMLAKAILRKLRAEVTHDSVARHFRDDTGSGNTLADAIAIDDRRLRNWKWHDRKAVNQHMLWRRKQFFHGHSHGVMRRTQDVDSVDLNRVNNANTPYDFSVRRKIDVNCFSQFRCQLLGIVQPSMPEFLGKNDGGGQDRPGQRPASNLVDSGDAGYANRAQFSFMAKSAAPVHRRKILKSRECKNL
jgi:hypothetical protein